MFARGANLFLDAMQPLPPPAIETPPFTQLGATAGRASDCGVATLFDTDMTGGC